jgi:1-acyl-sn-glycerol-3-phosphate acyltransferase
MILYSNHTGSLEVPLLFVYLRPRPVTGPAKIETWNNWFLGWLFDLWDIIPIRRGEADMEAMRACLDALEQGKILGMSPEGTRNKSGALLRAYPGIVVLALKSGAPLLPVAHWGGEDFTRNIKRLRRTDFRVRVGQPFKLDPGNDKITREMRQEMVDQMMYRLAALLPEHYRGEYADIDNMNDKYIRPIAA